MPGGDGAAAQTEEVDMVELEALDLIGLGNEHRPGDGPVAVVVADLAGVGDSRQVADELAHRAARLASRPVGRELSQA